MEEEEEGEETKLIGLKKDVYLAGTRASYTCSVQRLLLAMILTVHLNEVLNLSKKIDGGSFQLKMLLLRKKTLCPRLLNKLTTLHLFCKNRL